MGDQELLAEISRKLSILIALQLQREGSESMKDSISRLTRFGLSTGEIADILGTTPNTVAVAKNRLKNERK